MSGVSVHIPPDADRPRRRYGLEQLLRIIGLRTTYQAQPYTTIYCGSDPILGGIAKVWIPPDGNHHSSDGPPRITEVDGVPIPVYGTGPASLWNGNRLAFDIGQAAAFWLTLESERHASPRDAHDRLPAAASMLAGGRWLERPPVHAYADLLAGRLATHGACDQVLPRWPDGKKYAVALSHDVDGPERSGRLPGLLKELVGGGCRPRRQIYWDVRAEVSARGLWAGGLGPATGCREWDFDEFCAVERQHGLRSAFYFAVVNRSRGHPIDVSYDASTSRYRRLYRRLSAGGWEVGLHASYATCAARPPVDWQYDRLASLAGTPISGSRHHYLRFDLPDPMQTLAAHAAAGASYDTSAGFSDCPGFRPGVALPFEPYDPHRGAAGTLVELPMTIADAHLPSEDQSAAIDGVARMLETVRRLGGLAVLGWHVGHWHSAPGWRESYRAACRVLAEDSQAWVATPREIAAWWRRRSEALS